MRELRNPGAMVHAIIAFTFIVGTSTTQVPSPPPALTTVPIPQVDNLDDFVSSRSWAVVLGKALFWDQQVGSDGMACASCHFSAGADSRRKNQLSPSLNNLDPALATVFDPTRTGAGGPNYTLRLGDFPFHVLADPDDRDSAVLFDTNDVASSAGVFRAAFTTVGSPSTMFDPCTPVPDAVFHLGTRNTRRVEPRNTPTMINAVFNFRNFWDGRANNVFNGQNPFGPRDVNARVKKWSDGRLVDQRVALKNCSLASQAVGPPLSEFEMSCAGRTFPDVGRKLLDRIPLAFQQIAFDDSVLGAQRAGSGFGLALTYRTLIQRAFKSQWWSAPNTVLASGYTQIERNFSLFWGLAIQLYETTLVSDDAPYDRFRNGNTSALSSTQQRGLALFLDKGRCINCHGGPDFTNAGSMRFPQDEEEHATNEENLIQRMLMGDGRTAIYDEGFYNIGVRPTAEDRGVGGTDPFGNPLSFARQWLSWLNTGNRTVDSFSVDPRLFEQQVSLPYQPTREQLRAAFGNDPDAVDGAFKVPGLRNVELTGPYFHNGGQATLEQVVQFYDRGGDRRRRSNGGNTTGLGPNRSNLDPDIAPIGFTSGEQADLVAFLKSLTDDRVRWEKAPFDHPQLALPHGHGTGAHAQLGPQMAADQGEILPAVGRNGRAAIGLGALRSFAALLQ
jgi:cytochrome c peroxidase